MKSLTVLLKNSISTLLLLFILCATSYGQRRNFTQVRQDEGLIMRRLHSVAEGETPTLGTSIMNFHSDTPPGGTDRFDYMYMRATSDDKSNNVIITNDGTMMVASDDNCARLRDTKGDVDNASQNVKLYVNGAIATNDGLVMQSTHQISEEERITESGIVNFHSDTPVANVDGFDYIYMRATTNSDNNNNVIITNDGTMMIGASDVYDDLVTMKADVDNASQSNNPIKLYVNGGIAANDGNGTITILSDQRFKKNIIPLKNSLDVIRQSNFVEFQYNDLAGVPSNKKYYGILAQEMQKVLPSTVKKGRKMMRPDAKSATEFLMFNPNDLIYSGLNAIKELDKENQVLKDKVTELEAELEQRINELEKMFMKLTKGKELYEQNANTGIITDTAPSYLYQNQPNPIHNTTNIEYHLTSNTSNAQIIIQDLNGNQITKFNLKGEGTGSVTFNTKQFDISSGTYVYSLVINDTVIASKKMIFIE